MRIDLLRTYGLFRVVLAIVLIEGFGETDSVCRSAEQLPDKTAVVNAVREYLSSIQSIHLKYQSTHLLKEKIGELAVGMEIGPDLWEWAEQGRQRLLRFEPNTAIRQVSPMFVSHNGGEAYFLEYDPNEIDRVRFVRRTPEIIIGYSKPVASFMSGLGVPNYDGTLCDLLSTDLAIIVKHEEVFASRCLLVSIPSVIGMGGYRVAIDVWLDIDREYLPRRFVAKITDESPKILPIARTPFIVESPECQRVSDPLLGRMRWFPRTVTSSHSLESARINIDAVIVNERLPKSLFQPPLPTGTVIIDGEDRPFVSGKVSVVGGSTAMTALVDQRLQEAVQLSKPDAKQPTASDNLVNANASNEWNWRLYLSVASLLVLTVVGTRHLWFRG